MGGGDGSDGWKLVKRGDGICMRLQFVINIDFQEYVVLQVGLKKTNEIQCSPI